MSSSNHFWRTTLSSFVICNLLIWVAAFALDKVHPRLSCTDRESRLARQLPFGIVYDKVSAVYWVSRCADRSDGLFVSSSEGSGALRFGALALRDGYRFDEILNAHRGIKSFAYLMSFPAHPDRQKDFKSVVLLNPVYFSFAAFTDAAGIRLSAISTLAYETQIPTPFIKWNEYLALSPFIGTKEILAQFKILRSVELGGVTTKLEAAPADIAIPTDYDLDLNLLREKRERYQDFRSKFKPKIEPSYQMLKVIAREIQRAAKAKSCIVLLPVNGKLLLFNGRDPAPIINDLRSTFHMIPEANRVDLMDLSQEPYLFIDSMHLTDFGKSRVWDEIKKSNCFRRNFVDSGD